MPVERQRGVRKILIVEDDPLIVAMLRYNIDGTGHQTRVAGSVKEGWASIQEETPDAIILDITLPGPSGWDLLEMLRGDARFRQIPVVVTTGLPVEEVQDRAKGLLADYLPKPYDPTDMLDRLDRIITDARMFFGSLPEMRAKKLTEVVPMNVVILLDGYRIEGVVHLPPQFDRFSDAWQNLMDDERTFIPVTSASISQKEGEPFASAPFMEVCKRDIRALFGSSSGPRI